MLVGLVITGLVGMAATVGGAAAGAYVADDKHKEVGAAVGAAAGILTSGIVSAIYVAAVGDSALVTKKVSDATARGAGVAGALPQAAPSRLTTVGPLLVATR